MRISRKYWKRDTESILKRWQKALSAESLVLVVKFGGGINYSCLFLPDAELNYHSIEKIQGVLARICLDGVSREEVRDMLAEVSKRASASLFYGFSVSGRMHRWRCVRRFFFTDFSEDCSLRHFFQEIRRNLPGTRGAVVPLAFTENS